MERDRELVLVKALEMERDRELVLALELEKGWETVLVLKTAEKREQQCKLWRLAYRDRREKIARRKEYNFLRLVGLRD